MNYDVEHLRLLKIFHYIVGGMGCFFSCFPLLHVAMGVFMVALPESFNGSDGQNPPPDWVGFIFIGIGLLFFLLGQAMSICTIYSGRCIKSRSKYMFSFVVACISCLLFPFGTVLGVFSIVVLSRDSVKELYAASRNAVPATEI